MVRKRESPVIQTKRPPHIFNARERLFDLLFQRQSRVHGMIDAVTAKRKALLTHFGSLKKVQLATPEELKQVKGISAANITTIQAFFQGQTKK